MPLATGTRVVQDLTPGKDLEARLNKDYGPGNTFYEDFCACIKQGVKEGWVAETELDGPKYRRGKISVPTPETRYFSITTVFMDSQEEYSGQYHAHPYGEINCVIQIDAGAELRGMQGWQGAGWTLHVSHARFDISPRLYTSLTLGGSKILLYSKNQNYQPNIGRLISLKMDIETSDLHHVDSGKPADTTAEKGSETTIHIDPVAERKLRLKIDLAVVPTVSLLYLFCFIDRANLGNAKIAGMDTELNMKGYDYNIIISCFYVSYIVFEIPTTMLCKYMGPGWFIPLTTILFGVASLGTAWVHTVSAASGVRFVLGIFEAGMMPGIAYYLSRWYRRAELAFRISLYIVMAPLAGAFGGLLASAILTLDSFGDLHQWRMIFAIEGIITIGLGFIGLVTLTDRPETARWLTAEEKVLAIERVRMERVGASEVLDKIDAAKTWRGIFNPLTLSTAFIFLLNNVTVQGLAFFLPTIVKTIYKDATTVRLQLQTVPPISSAPSKVAMVRYAATFLIAMSSFPFGPIANAQASANVISDTARGAAIATTVMLGNVGGLISGWSFLPWDAPDYKIGNGLNLATSSTALLAGLAIYAWAKMDNRKRRSRDSGEELQGLTQRQVEDLDWKHPDFMWRL
ncbi:unnamed protein product [Parascedosporium putredinis]|uniref:Major facilitator superfamily (MFS) profile domain-containing protein n=1 Tax=Parascedosporium putredinis TaxID=1442378 RepID=A0A9P1GYL1_9PEZI|nr:unnamed protein product [Parascedosporium putredinis]CAI7990860.1 unnamed protein product [Parascedosporium putredinis]